jgi:hypothetical protein
VAPLQLGGLRGKKSTPSVWLGGTGEFFVVDKQEQERQEHRKRCSKKIRQRYVPELSRVDYMVSYYGDYDGMVVICLSSSLNSKDFRFHK